MLDNYFSGLSNITVDGNRLVGGGYTVYLDGRFGGGTVDDASIQITNNPHCAAVADDLRELLTSAPAQPTRRAPPPQTT